MKDYFSEIVGYEEVKKELSIISDMLNNPEIYQNLGASINEGIVLSGRPGTGKTTMANCLIRSVDRKAYIIRKKGSDGDFIKTIENIFADARQNAPSIILLDDLDKFSDQNENCDAEEFVTIQSCIDEIRESDIYVIATVNNIRKIPKSLLRAGRLGKRLKIRLPNEKEAEEIIKHYMARSSMFDKLEEESIARMLEGESCATLESVINNAAIKAAYNRQNKVTMQNIIDSCLDLIFDAPESSDPIPEDILKKIAYHESGHALISELLDPGSVSLMSIRKTNDGDYGFVRYYRSEEKTDNSAEYNESIIKVSLSGKAATELVFGETDMGANADLHNAFHRATCLVDNECMFGFQNWIEDEHDEYAAENRNRTVSLVMEKNYLEVKKLLADNRNLLDRMASELLDKITLVRMDVQRIMNENKNKASYVR